MFDAWKERYSDYKEYKKCYNEERERCLRGEMGKYPRGCGVLAKEYCTGMVYGRGETVVDVEDDFAELVASGWNENSTGWPHPRQ